MDNKLLLSPDFTSERIELIKQTYCKGGSDLDLQLFISTCERLKLSPEARQIYAVIRNGKNGPQMTIQVSIDGFRLVADRSDKYEGQTPVQWCGSDGHWKEIWTGRVNPIAARVGVLKRGFKAPLYAVAHWDEYVQMAYGNPAQFWAKMPRLMLGKVAEALALRKAFPNELSGVYAPEEMGKGISVESIEIDDPASDSSGDLTAEPRQLAPAPIISPVEIPYRERVPKMLKAFEEIFGLRPEDVAEILGKPIADLSEENFNTMKTIFVDLKSGALDVTDLAVIKDVLSQPPDSEVMEHANNQSDKE